MRLRRRTGCVAVAAAALVAAPLAGGKPHAGGQAPNGNAHGWTNNHTASTETEGTTTKPGGGPKAHNVKYIFKGTYEGAGVVAVKKGNAHVRKGDLTGISVTFDLSAAKLVVDDTNGDGAITVDDVLVDDKVHVQARLPKGAPGAQPFAARKLVDQTHPADDGADPVEEPAPVE